MHYQNITDITFEVTTYIEWKRHTPKIFYQIDKSFIKEILSKQKNCFFLRKTDKKTKYNFDVIKKIK